MLIGSFTIRKESHLPGDELRRGRVIPDIEAGHTARLVKLALNCEIDFALASRPIPEERLNWLML